MKEAKDGIVNQFTHPRIYVPVFSAVFLFLIPLLVKSPFYHDVMITTFLFATSAAAWNLLGGFGGQISLGHTAFFGIGAYTSTLLYLHFGISPWIGMFVGAALSILVGIGIGIPCFRLLRTHFFALATIAFASILHILAVYFRGLTKGTVGIVIPFKEGWSYLMFRDKLPYVYITLVMMLLAIAFFAFVRRSRMGFYLNAIREDQDAAEALGVATTWYKLAAFIISIFFVSVSGTIYAQYIFFIDPDSVFSFQISVNMALFSMIGGLGTVLGPVIGAFILTPLDVLLRGWLGPQFVGLNLLIYGIILAIVVRFFPYGIINWVQKIYDFIEVKLPGYQPVTEAKQFEPLLSYETEKPSALPRAEDHSILLEVRGLTKSFGGLAAVKDVDFQIRQGEIVGLIGPNGAGKTTIFNLINGFISPDAGELRFKGEIITRLNPPHKICAKHIGRSFQIVKPFSNMTVLENVMVGAFSRTVDSEKARRKARETLKFCGLAKYQDFLALNLTIADRKRLELSRALAGNPELLLSDEIMAGLTPTETTEIIELVCKISRQGTTIFLIEHVMQAVMSLSNKVIVLNYGRKIAEGGPQEIAKNREVIEAYLGEEYAG